MVGDPWPQAHFTDRVDVCACGLVQAFVGLLLEGGLGSLNEVLGLKRDLPRVISYYQTIFEYDLLLE